MYKRRLVSTTGKSFRHLSRNNTTASRVNYNAVFQLRPQAPRARLAHSTFIYLQDRIERLIASSNQTCRSPSAEELLDEDEWAKCSQAAAAERRRDWRERRKESRR